MYFFITFHIFVYQSCWSYKLNVINMFLKICIWIRVKLRLLIIMYKFINFFIQCNHAVRENGSGRKDQARRQHFTRKWMEVKGFEAWLRPVPFDVTKANCIACRKHLTAHFANILRIFCVMRKRLNTFSS